MPEAAHAEPPAAWAYWPRWSGQSALLPHVARTAAQAATDLLGAKVGWSIDVRVPVRPSGHDVERAESAEEFHNTVSAEALTRFDSIRIIVQHPKLDVETVFARARGFGPEWLDRGVLLEVRAADNSIELVSVCRVRDRVLSALNRGLPRFRGTVATGEGRAPVPPDVTRRRSVAWVEKHFGSRPIRRLRDADIARLRAEDSTTLPASKGEVVGETVPRRQLDPRLRELAARFSSDIEMSKRELAKYRFLITRPPSDVEEYILNEHLDWIAHPEFAQPLRFFVESGHWLWPSVLTFVAGLTSLGWGRYVLVLVIASALVGGYFSHRLAEFMFLKMEFTDVSPIRRFFARIGIWMVGPGISVMTFLLGRLLR